MSSYYGVIFPEFWTGPTGRELRTHGKDAQLIGLYLATNRHANMIGLYRLIADDIRHETGFGLKGIAKALDAIARTEYALYDAASAYVWVRSMARFRLGLRAGDGIKGDDKRIPAINRMYQALDPNPFLGAFFDVNQRTLRLERRRDDAGLVVSLMEHHQIQPHTRGLEAPTKPVTDSSIRNRYQEQEKAAAAPRDNMGVITKLAHVVIDESGFTDFPSLKEELKQRCRDERIECDSETAGGALESALTQRRKRA